MSINKSDIWEHWTTTPDVSSFKQALTQSSVQLLFDASEDTQRDVYNTIKCLGKQVVVESTDLEDADSHDDIQGILTNEISESSELEPAMKRKRSEPSTWSVSQFLTRKVQSTLPEFFMKTDQKRFIEEFATKPNNKSNQSFNQ